MATNPDVTEMLKIKKVHDAMSGACMCVRMLNNDENADTGQLTRKMTVPYFSLKKKKKSTRLCIARSLRAVFVCLFVCLTFTALILITRLSNYTCTSIWKIAVNGPN